MKAWFVACCGVDVIVFANSRSRAKWLVISSAIRAGYDRSSVFKSVQIRRERKYDRTANREGTEGVFAINTVESMERQYNEA